jgi:hypothetical protein
MFRYSIATVLAAGVLSGCVSNVSRDAYQTAPAAVTASTVSFGSRPVAVHVVLNDEAQKQLPDNAHFDAKKLQQAVEDQLDSRHLLAKPGQLDAMQLAIEVTDIRTRSTATAMLFGFMAGNDHIEGTAQLVDAQNRPVDRFDISASYALGGFVGGLESQRMGWLYNKFATKTMDGLTKTE